jgi:4'-phosphopantetheinyl transferase
LGPDEIHIWSAVLDPPEASVAALAATLSPDERIRAARFIFPIHRRHFAVGRGLQRAVLGHYLRLQPAELRFHYGQPADPV